jgi:Ca-activated chloride channel family protein
MLVGSLTHSAALAAQPVQDQSLTDGAGREIVQASCNTECHGLGVIRASVGHDVAGWREVMSTMVDLSAAETSLVAEYLARHFPELPAGELPVVTGVVDVETPQWPPRPRPSALTSAFFPSIQFVRPELLELLFLIPAWWLVVWPWTGRGVRYVRGGSTEGGGWRATAAFIWSLPRLLRTGAFASLIVALAHPQVPEIVQEPFLRGRSMVIAVDISTSMLADDMEQNRIRMDVAREAAADFAASREIDELTLVAFAGESVTRVPATTDPRVVVAGVESLVPQLVLDGTDISAAMLNSIAELVKSERDERVIVLLTDGAHNGSGIDPLQTARAAAALDMRVHSIALLGEPEVFGSGLAARAARDRQAQMEAEIATVLTSISRLTGGEYFRASSGAALDSIYGYITAIEAPIEEVAETTVYRSLRLWPLLAALLLVGIEAAVRGSRWGLVP